MIADKGFTITVTLPDLRQAQSSLIRLNGKEAGVYEAAIDAALPVPDAPGVVLRLVGTLRLQVPIPDINQPGVIPETDA